MASTSGRVQSGVYNYTYFYFQWQLAGQDIAGNYSTINWQWGVNISSNAFWGSNSIKSISGYINGGQAIGGNTWSSISGNGDHQLLSGSWTIGHNSDGTKNFGISSTGWFYGGGNYGNSGAWDLPTIPRHANLTAVSGDFNDEFTNPWVEFSNPAGVWVDGWFELPDISGAGTIAYRGGIGSRYTWTLTDAEKDTFRTKMANVSSTRVRFVIHDTLGGDNWSYTDRTITIVNGNPTFTDFTFRDSNATTSAITGNDQILIQGKSTLEAKVATAQKMIAIKQATAVNYTATIDGVVNTQPYSGTADVIFPIGVMANGGTKTLSMRANDSRANSTTVSKDLTILPYVSPDLTLTATRLNNFDNATTLKVTGIFSRLTVGATDKNSIVANSLKYRLSQDGGAFSGWTTIPFTQTAGTLTATDQVISLANSSVWTIEVQVQDKLTTYSKQVIVDRGIPLLFIGDGGKIGVNKMPDSAILGANGVMDVNGDIYVNGRKVRVENDYFFSVYFNTTATIGDGATVDMQFTTKIADPLNLYTTADSSFTAPVSGYYYLSSQVELSIQGAGGTSGRWLWEGRTQLVDVATGNQLESNHHYTYADGRMTGYDSRMGRLHYLTAGQKVKIRCMADTNDGTGYQVVGGSANTSPTYWTGFLWQKG